ncbi:hypothetical protein NQ314_014102 [Rhamnusium bicolor]|uniref:Uncharacterized protein n=1 Tax=Rhamnusium bicolor TaxID=1586634 RepID=A0AAV8X3D6_9CUCU|nr:hypothetical protein NQ314_014102 [Rhamnusium bicolor]
MATATASKENSDVESLPDPFSTDEDSDYEPNKEKSERKKITDYFNVRGLKQKQSAEECSDM